MRPDLRVWVLFVVVLRGGCGWFGGVRLIICDLGCLLRWYLFEGWGLRDFLQRYIKVKFLIARVFKGCSDKNMIFWLFKIEVTLFDAH